LKRKKILALILKDFLPWGIDQVSGIVSTHLKQKSRELVTEQIDNQDKLIKKIAKQTGKSTSIMTRNVEDIGISKDEVGRRTWDKIHDKVAALPQDVDPHIVKQTMDEISDIIHEYPCTDCRENAIKNLKKFKEMKGKHFTDAKNRNEAIMHAFEYHNIVNEMLEKNPYTLEQLQNNYDF